MCNYIDNSTDIYISSDFHGFHKNICRGSTSWSNPELNCREFNDEFEMTDVMIKNINSSVKKQDMLIHLGDIAFGGKSNVQKLLQRINCRNLVLLNGNHDYGSAACSNVILECDYLELRLDSKVLVCMFHYPIASWNEMHHGSIMLHGHTHLKYKGDGRIKDVEMNGNNMFPYNLTDVVNELLQIPMVNNKRH